jgi:hypothetical protein
MDQAFVRVGGIRRGYSKLAVQNLPKIFLALSSSPKPVSKREHCRATVLGRQRGLQMLERSMEWRGSDPI